MITKDNMNTAFLSFGTPFAGVGNGLDVFVRDCERSRWLLNYDFAPPTIDCQPRPNHNGVLLGTGFHVETTNDAPA
jgi:hypothetical protein